MADIVNVTAPGRTIPVVSTRLRARDVLGGWKVRWNIGRMRYSVQPGLYGVGSPGPSSPVLVTANYKLTFDSLRSRLRGIDTWILVLDTRGINVWCAAGKGTFGTEELVRRVKAVALDTVVAHRTLILPQLAAPGVAAHKVRAESGWTVRYGPVQAKDIASYLAAGMKKTDAMRLVPFGIRERMVIAPVELMQSWPVLAAVLAGAGLLALPFAPGWVGRFLQTFVPLTGAVLVGTLAFPALLPWIPPRAFALKGAILGALWGLGCALVLGAGQPVWTGLVRGAALVLLSTPIAAFLAMNFTGSSTFTCQPGAALEVKYGLLPMAASLLAGVGVRVAAVALAL